VSIVGRGIAIIAIIIIIIIIIITELSLTANQTL